MMDKTRIDIYLSDHGYAQTRTQAQRLVMAGKVLVNEIPCEKPSQPITENDVVRVKESLQYVSRGALKLAKALDAFGLDVKGRTFIDFGASTGGFTDVLLQRGARHVSCVDVGYGQLAWKIRNDERVSVYERTNARYLTPETIGGKKDAAVCDVSFISVKKLLPAMDACTKGGGFIIILIKPQFEAGKERVGKNGVVRDPAVHEEVIKDITAFVDGETSFNSIKLEHSPLKGQKGNIEYLLLAQKTAEADVSPTDIKDAVEKAFGYF